MGWSGLSQGNSDLPSRKKKIHNHVYEMLEKFKVIREERAVEGYGKRYQSELLKKETL